MIVAGSTWEEDEEELDHYANTHPEIRFIIAPHEIEEDHLKDIETLIPEYHPVFAIGKTIRSSAQRQSPIRQPDVQMC